MEQLDKLSDTELVIKYIQEREPEYIHIFLKKHTADINSNIMRVLKAYKIFGDRAKDIRDDIFHDVFIEVLTALGTEPGFDQWIRGIVHRVSLREARKIVKIFDQTGNNNQQNMINTMSAAGSGKRPMLSDELHDVIEQFNDILSKKNKKHSDIFSMHHFDGYTASEIARKFNTSKGTIEVTLNRLKDRFEAFLRRKRLL